MTEQDKQKKALPVQNDTKDDAKSNNAKEETGPDNANSQDEAQKSVKKGGLIVLLIIVFSLLWYLYSDRYTPYTQQARIQGYVVGVSSKVSGIVTKVWVKNNHLVEKDQPLFQIDQDSYKIALNRAQSDLEKVQEQINASSAGIESAQANLLAAQANFQKALNDSNRLEKLYKKDSGAISMRRLESSRTSLEHARAKVFQAEAEVQRAIEQKGGEGDDNAQLKSALSAVQKARLDLENTTVKASAKGIVTDLRTDVGQFSNTGQPVMTLISLNDIWISAEFTENNLGHITKETPVEIVFDVLPGQVYSGKIRSIGLGVSSGQPPPAGTLPTIQNSRDWLRQSQRYPVIVDFDISQDENLKHNLRIGGQAEVIAYPEDVPFLNFLAHVYIRMMSWFSYAY
jgi:multidrug resistance efflux pump